MDEKNSCLSKRLCTSSYSSTADDACLSTHESSPFFVSPPTPEWFLASYVRDVWSRLDTLKASATSIYGTILKIDSTKKITKKLHGKSANSASWCTNVGNERGEVLVSLLTTSEGLSKSNRMADGLMERYSQGVQPPPLVLYTDRNCCKTNDLLKFQKLFQLWDNLPVRLDLWHFKRRLSKACTNESHPLYGTFMAKISACIFEWDSGDMLQLKNVKRIVLYTMFIVFSKSWTFEMFFCLLGTSANEIHFQAYLIEGLCRWNAARCSASTTSRLPNTRSFNVQLQDRIK